jgi:high-affinity iron transporter
VVLLNEAKETLNTTGMSKSAAFFGSFIILLREGVEAILVLAAIMAALIKTGRRDAMKYIHYGWISAVVLGIMTWWVADNLIQISGASREVTEGIAALVAAAILVYVGFWLHNASHSKRWKAFVEHKVGNAMEGGTLWVLAAVVFLAVYREMFETVLFYQAMWVQIDTGSEQSFFIGILAALAVLVVLSLLVYKLGIKLPIKQFFQINAVLLFLLAVVFTGQGIAALQEAGIVSTSLLNFPRIEVLGVYPTAQSLGLQLLVLLLGAGLLMYQKRTN